MLNTCLLAYVVFFVIFLTISIVALKQPLRKDHDDALLKTKLHLCYLVIFQTYSLFVAVRISDLDPARAIRRPGQKKKFLVNFVQRRERGNEVNTIERLSMTLTADANGKDNF